MKLATGKIDAIAGEGAIVVTGGGESIGQGLGGIAGNEFVTWIPGKYNYASASGVAAFVSGSGL